MGKYSNTAGCLDFVQKFTGWQSFTQKGNRAPDQYMDDIVCIAVFDPRHYQNALSAGVSTSLTIFEQPAVTETAIMLGHQQHAIAAAPKLHREFWQRPFPIV